jgi:hypothetical protein
VVRGHQTSAANGHTQGAENADSDTGQARYVSEPASHDDPDDPVDQSRQRPDPVDTVFEPVVVSNAQITADDDNTAAGEYTYTITVSSGGNTYSTNATLVADPPGYGRTPPMPIGGGSNTPTIKNN